MSAKTVSYSGIILVMRMKKDRLSAKTGAILVDIIQAARFLVNAFFVRARR